MDPAAHHSRKRGFGHLNTEEDVLRAASAIMTKRVARRGASGGRGYDGLNENLLLDACTYYPLKEWQRVVKLAAARTDVPAELNTAQHMVVLDRTDVVDAALVAAAEKGGATATYDDKVEFLKELARDVAEHAKSNQDRRKAPGAGGGAQAQVKRAHRARMNEATRAEAALAVLRSLSLVDVGGCPALVPGNHPCPESLPEHDAHSAAAFGWLFEHASTAAQADLAAFAETWRGDMVAKNVLLRRLEHAAPVMAELMATSVKIGHIQKAVLEGPLANTHERWLQALGLDAGGWDMDALAFPTGQALRDVVRGLLPDLPGRAAHHPELDHPPPRPNVDVADVGVSVVHDAKQMLEHVCTWDSVFEHLEKELAANAEHGGKGLVAITGHDGFQATKGSNSDKKGRMMTNGWISLGTVAMRISTTYISVVFTMTENDKPKPTAYHLPWLFGQDMFQGPCTINVAHPNTGTTLSVPITHTIWVGDMAGLHNTMMLKQPKDCFYWNMTPSVAKTATRFQKVGGYLNYATPNRTRERIRRHLDDCSVSDADLGNMGFDVSNAGLRNHDSLARVFGVEEFPSVVGLLHCHSDHRSNWLALVAAVASYLSHAQLERLMAQLRKFGLNLRPMLRYGGNGIKIQAKQRQIRDAYLKANPVQLMWMEGVDERLNILLARQNVLFAFRSRLMFLGDSDNLDLLNGCSATALVAQTCLGHFNSAGTGVHIHARMTPSAANNVFMMPWVLRLCQRMRLPPIVLDDTQHEDSHSEAIQEAQHGAAKGGGDHKLGEAGLGLLQCEAMDDALRLIRKIQSASKPRSLPHLEDKTAKAAAALVKGLLETFPTKDTDEQLRAFPFTGEDVCAPGKPEHLLRQHELPPAESNQGDTLAARVRAHLAAQAHVKEQAACAKLPPAAVRCSLIDRIVFSKSRATGSPVVVTLDRGPDDEFELSFTRSGDLVLAAKKSKESKEGDKRVEIKMELAAITHHELTHLANHVGNDPAHIVYALVPLFAFLGLFGCQHEVAAPGERQLKLVVRATVQRDHDR